MAFTNWNWWKVERVGNNYSQMHWFMQFERPKIGPAFGAEQKTGQLFNDLFQIDQWNGQRVDGSFGNKVKGCSNSRNWTVNGVQWIVGRNEDYCWK